MSITGESGRGPVKMGISVADIGAGMFATTGILLALQMRNATGKGQQVVASESERHSGSGVAIDTQVVDGEPVGALIEAARSGGYDLMVVGNRGMTGVTRFLRLGSVPNKVSHHLPCSLLIVKTT